MKKEVLIAIAVGFGLGLIITFGIWTANKSLKQLNVAKVANTPLPSSPPAVASPLPSPTSELTISSPENEALVNKSGLTVTGKFLPKSAITITYEEDATIVETDATGNFSADVVLIGGYNTIVVTGIDLSTGVESTQTLIVTYTTAKI